MAEIKYEDYKAYVLSTMVKIDAGLNLSAIGMSDREAREKKLWLNKDKLPSESDIRAQFGKLKKQLQKEADRLEKQDSDRQSSADASAEFDELFSQLYDQDEDLGLSDKQLSKLGMLLNLNKKHKALLILKRSKLLKGE